MTSLTVPAICFSVSRHAQEMHRKKEMWRQRTNCRTNHGVTIAASSWRPRHPSSRGNKCNRSGTHPTGSVLRTDPGEKLPLPFFRLGGRLSGSRLSPPPTRRRHRIEPWAELLHLQKTIRRGMDYLQCQLLHKRVPQATSLQRLPPVAADQLIEISPNWGPRPASQSTNHIIHL